MQAITDSIQRAANWIHLAWIYFGLIVIEMLHLIGFDCYLNVIKFNRKNRTQCISYGLPSRIRANKFSIRNTLNRII